MLGCSDGDNVGETKRLKQKLQEHYNDHVEKYEDVFCFQNAEWEHHLLKITIL